MTRRMTRTTRKTTTDITRAVLYARVSTDEQAQEGVSLAAQEARMRGYAAMAGLEITAVVVDAGVSAGKPLADRPGGRRVLEAVRTGEAGTVVALKLDRMFRSATDCLVTADAWTAAGASLRFVDLGGQPVDTATPTGRFFLTVLAACAELERGQIRDRIKTALAHKAACGERVGGIPYGRHLAADGVALVVDEAEQATMAAARDLRAAGLSLRAVGAALAARGMLPRCGGVWNPKTVRTVCEAA